VANGALVPRGDDGNGKGEAGAGAGAKPDPAAVEFFEKNVRPILAARCHECHGPLKQKGGLRLDARASVLAGGSTGPAVVPGNPDESLLVDAINYGEARQMPPKSKLPLEEIDTLTEWVRRGAPWGIPSRPAALEPGAAKRPAAPESLSDGEYESRARFWSFQRLRRIVPPSVATDRAGWPRNPIDRFILAVLEQHGLTPAVEADRRTLIRRLSFDLTGLPPAPAEVSAFVADTAPGAYERLVDRLLASPHYGERWARHWLDLVRYAETAGHEFDYDIPNAFRYRDYVIRAFNADLPYDRFVVEQIAGDLLEEPRRHPSQGFNESVIGTGFYFLGEGTHSPVDVREEEMRRIDNQIDVLAKTFLGLTVACARCHDHKFDPITQRDYYALAGFLHSSRHQQGFIDPPERSGGGIRRLRALKETIATALGDARELLPEPLRGQVVSLTALRGDQVDGRSQRSGRAKAVDEVFEDFGCGDFDGWYTTGDAFGDRPSRAGDFRLDFEEKAPRLVTVGAGQAHSGLVSKKLQGVLRSRSFAIRERHIHYLASGRGGRISVVIDGFEKIRAPIYGGLTTEVNVGEAPRWLTQDVGMWLGHQAYLEIADGATVNFGGATSQLDGGRGYIALDEIRMSNQAAPRAGGTAAAVVAIDLGAVIGALEARHHRLARRLAAALEQARAIENMFPEPALALAMADGTGTNERVHIRGSHQNLGEVVPRSFLQVLGSSDSSAQDGSGRDELARRMVDPNANPLVPRVLVNRLWKHHFGEGIVKSADDFGAMGSLPAHPELLDWLASELVASGWSIKALQRLMVTSSTYRMASRGSEDSERLDPANRFWHRMNVRRLEAEAIRDALLAVSGRLDQAMYGPSVPAYLTDFMEGRGRPKESGPLDGDGRRSIYLSVRRNFLNPMLLAFDAPVPFSTIGRRNVSNVAAQALTLLNDPLVLGQARLWAESALEGPSAPDCDRLDRLYLAAFGRLPDQSEARAACRFLAADRPAGDGGAKPSASALARKTAWANLCHVLINTKEFIFVK
jgi:hypothetical protein